MFDKNQVPLPNAQMQQHLANLFNHTGANAEQKLIIEKKIEKVENTLQTKIINTVTVSEYFDDLWKQPDLKKSDQEFVIKKVEAIQKNKRNQIERAEQKVAKESGNLNVINTTFSMTPYEEFNYQEKLKNVRKKRKLDMESDLFTNHPTDLDILHALNKPTRFSLPSAREDQLHYTAGLYDVDDSEAVKKQKAEEFVKKIQEAKKAFQDKLKQMEKKVEDREQEEIENYKKREQEEEEQRLREKKLRLENHIKELKAKSEFRLKEKERWEQEYKEYLGKKPLYKEYETKFKQGFVIPELEERKKKLQEIRDFHKPILREHLLEHEQKILKNLEERQQEKKEQLENSRWTYKKPEFESKHHKILTEELIRQRKHKEEEQMQKMKRKEKVAELLQDVKEKHLPKVDPQKELELLSMVEKLKKRKDGRSALRYQEEKNEGIDPKKLGGEYLRSVKELVQKARKENPKLSKPNEIDMTDNEQEKVDRKIGTISTKSEPNLRKFNYLAELRKQNKVQSSSNQVDLIIKNKNLGHKERKELLISEIEKLEEKAKRIEQINKHKIRRNAENAEDVHGEGEADQYYINAIKAKLQMLGH